MKNKRAPIVTSCLIGAGLLAVAAYVIAEQNLFAAEPPVDPAHAAHVAAGAMPRDASMGDPALLLQLSELKAKVAQLEAALAGNVAHPPVATAPAAGAMPGMAGPATPPASGGGMGMGMGMGMMEDDMGEMSAMQSDQGAPAGAGMGGMAGGATPPGMDAGMTARLDKMIGMMDRMVDMMDRTVRMMDRMGGGKDGVAAATVAPMAGGMMDDDKMEMGGMGGGTMQPAQAAPPMGGDM